MYLQALVGYAKDLHTAQQGAWENWRNNMFGNRIQSDLKTPQDFDTVGQKIHVEEMDDYLRISCDLDQHIEWLRGDIALGFERIFVFSAAQDQTALIRDFGKHVLPALAT